MSKGSVVTPIVFLRPGSFGRHYKNGAPGSVILGNGSPYLHTDTPTARK